MAASEHNSDICKAHYWNGVAGMTVGVETGKRERTDVYGCTTVQYEGSWGVGGRMLIGLWGAEPQQINSSERITARADIKPPPPSNTHFHLTTHKGERR